MDFIARCKSHAAHGVLDRALKQCDHLSHLVNVLICGIGSLQPNGPPGGFARHLANSSRLRRKFEQRRLDELSEATSKLLSAADIHNPKWSAKNLSFAMERFDALVEPLKKLLMNTRVLFAVLADEVSDIRGHRDWAQNILNEMLSYKSLVTLALFVEAYLVGKDFVHGFDAKHAGPFSCVARVKPACEAFLSRLDELFGGDSPLVFSKRYTNGVVHHVLKMLQGGIVVQSSQGTVGAASWPGDWVTRNAPLAQVRHFIKWVKIYLQAAFPHQEFQQAFAPFDIAAFSGNDAIGSLKAHFEPIAKARGVNVEDVIHQFCAVKPLANAILRTGVSNTDEYWSRALRERSASASYAALSAVARPMMSQVVGTMEIEQDFSLIQDLIGPRRNMNVDLVRAQCKIRLDGPPPHELETCFLQRIAAKYVEMFGGRDASRTEARRKQAAVPFVDRRTGVPQPKRQSGMALWDRERKGQLKDLSAAPRQSDSLLGAPRTVDDHRQVELLEQTMWTSEKEASKRKAQEQGKLLAAKLQSDRLPAGSKERQAMLRADVSRERKNTANVKSAKVTPYELEAAAGNFEDASLKLVFGQGLREGSRSRRHLERGQVGCTSSIQKALQTPASHVFVDSVESVLRQSWDAGKDPLLARILGAALVCPKWLDCAEKYKKFPRAPVRFHGLKSTKEVFFHKSFAKEHPDLAHLLGQALELLKAPVCCWVRRASVHDIKAVSRGVVLMGSDAKAGLPKRKFASISGDCATADAQQKKAKIEDVKAAKSGSEVTSATAASSAAKPTAARSLLATATSFLARHHKLAASKSAGANKRVTCQVAAWDANDIWSHLNGGSVPKGPAKYEFERRR